MHVFALAPISDTFTQEGSCSINYDLCSAPLYLHFATRLHREGMFIGKCNFYKAVTRRNAEAVARQATCSLPKSKQGGKG